MTKQEKNLKVTSIKDMRARLKKTVQPIEDQKQRKKELYDAKEWYTARALLGNQWANWFVMAGARER